MDLLELTLPAAKELLISSPHSTWSALSRLSNKTQPSSIQGKCDWGKLHLLTFYLGKEIETCNHTFYEPGLRVVLFELQNPLIPWQTLMKDFFL